MIGSSTPSMSWTLALTIFWIFSVVSGIFTSENRITLLMMTIPFLFARTLGLSSLTSGSCFSERLMKSSMAVSDIVTWPSGFSKAIVFSLCIFPLAIRTTSVLINISSVPGDA